MGSLRTANERNCEGVADIKAAQFGALNHYCTALITEVTPVVVF